MFFWLCLGSSHYCDQFKFYLLKGRRFLTILDAEEGFSRKVERQVSLKQAGLRFLIQSLGAQRKKDKQSKSWHIFFLLSGGIYWH